METNDGAETIKDPFMKLLCIINRKWTVLVIVAIGNFEGVRFNDLKRELHCISSKTLSETIRELDNIGVVTTVRSPGPPLRIKYYLTEEGKELRKAVLPALEWIYEKVPACNIMAVKNAFTPPNDDSNSLCQ